MYLLLKGYENDNYFTEQEKGIRVVVVVAIWINFGLDWKKVSSHTNSKTFKLPHSYTHKLLTVSNIACWPREKTAN